MFSTTPNTLIKLAALVWYIGVIVLTTKSSTLLLNAFQNGINPFFVFMAVFCGVVIGKLKATYFFNNICKKNITRIHSLADPKLWQFYRKRFFLFLLSMIMLGEYLSGVVQSHAAGLVSLAVLELSIAAALAFSSICFWRK